jgi:hypothetical protein
MLKVKVNLSLCFNWAPPHGGVLGRVGITLRILNIGAFLKTEVGWVGLAPVTFCTWWRREKTHFPAFAGNRTLVA